MPQMSADFHRLTMDGKRVAGYLSLHFTGEGLRMYGVVGCSFLCVNLVNLRLELPPFLG